MGRTAANNVERHKTFVMTTKKSKTKQTEPIMIKLERWAKVLAVVFTVLGIASAYGAMQSTVSANANSVSHHTNEINELMVRTTRLEEAIKDIPEIKRDVKELLKRGH